jgi:hypothetical protein
MKHQLSVMNRLHNQQKLQSVLEFLIKVGKQFIQIQPQPQLMKKRLIIIEKVVIIKN